MNGPTSAKLERDLVRLIHLRDFLGVWPTYDEIAEHLGFAWRGLAVDLVGRLVRAGFLERAAHRRQRAVRLTPRGRRLVLGVAVPGLVEVPWGRDAR